MAGSHRTPPDGVNWAQALAAAPQRFDFFQALRRLECQFREQPRVGQAQRPAEESVRLGQEADLGFAPSALAGAFAGQDDRPLRLMVSFLGLLGPNGPLPLHLTEYARERVRHGNDNTLVRFLDLFHHRTLSLFYRAWADARPAVSADRPAQDPFLKYVGATVGTGLPALRGEEVADGLRRYFAGRFGAQSRNAEGLSAVLGACFEVPAQIEQFVGRWETLPENDRWCLGRSSETSRLGRTTFAGARVWSCAQKFRVVLGPMSREQFAELLPGQPGYLLLGSVMQQYVGVELSWDVKLLLDEADRRPLTLGRGSRLGWDSWLGRSGLGKGTGGADVLLDPEAQRV